MAWIVLSTMYQNTNRRKNVFDLNNDKVNLSRANALCVLKSKEKGRVPQTVVDSFVENATQVTQTSIDLLKAGVTNCLQKAGINVETLPGLQDLFDENSLISNPFDGIDKESLQYKYYKEKFNLVVSIKYIIPYFENHVLYEPLGFLLNLYLIFLALFIAQLLRVYKVAALKYVNMWHGSSYLTKGLMEYADLTTRNQSTENWKL